MRRQRWTAIPVVTVLATLLLGSMPAAAQTPTADDVRVDTPREGTVLKDRVTLQVSVDVGSPSKVDLRLTQDGQAIASGTAFTSLPCIEGCDEAGTSSWGGRTYDPSLGAPFSPKAQCNGQWMLQPRVNGGAWLRATPFSLMVPPKAPSNVRISVTDDDVAVITWTPDKSPDVAFHRVERSTGGGPFAVLAQLAGVADRYEDKGITKGEHVYRVVAARPDGLVNGQPAPPCSDTGAELVASSKNTKLTHTDEGSVTEGPSESPSSSPTSSPTGSGGSGTSGGGTSPTGSGSGGGTTAPASGGSTSEPGAEPSPSPSASSSPRPARSARPVAPPPSAQRRTTPIANAPELGNRPEDDGPYYGEGEDFTTEIDYGDAEGIPGEQVVVGYDDDGQPIFETVTVPGEIVAFGVVTIDNGKVRMIAMGLLLVALALHGRRWLNAH